MYDVFSDAPPIDRDLEQVQRVLTDGPALIGAMVEVTLTPTAEAAELAAGRDGDVFGRLVGIVGADLKVWRDGRWLPTGLVAIDTAGGERVLFADQIVDLRPW